MKVLLLLGVVFGAEASQEIQKLLAFARGLELDRNMEIGNLDHSDECDKIHKRVITS